MRIGITGGGATADRIVQQAVDAERDGFSSVWYASAVAGDPLVAIALAGRATTTIELGTAVLQTYPTHPLTMANRAASVAAAIGRPGFALGVGPSHAPVIEGIYGLSYARPGQHSEEYTRILVAALQGEVDFSGEFLEAHSAGRVARPDHPITVLLGALAPRMLRVAGEFADGTVTWMANARALERQVVPRLRAAAAGRADPRVVVGLPVVVHDDIAEGRSVAAQQFAMYGTLPNYRRILDVGGVDGPADAAIVGDEASVSAQLQELIDAGATDIWTAPFPVGDRHQSRVRTLALLASLATP